MKLKGKVALVTGSNRGIGRGIAIEMAREGADIVVNYRSHAAEGDETAAEVRKLGRRAIICQADVGNRAQVDAMVAQGVKDLGRLDICVCNAAFTIRKSCLELTSDEFRKIVDVSLLGVFGAAQACAKQMVKQGSGGAILLVSSVHAFIPFGHSIAYNTCKGGLNQMAFTMAEELCSHRIRVNVLEPGWIDTPGERDMTPADQLAAAGKKLPWGRMGTIEDMGKTATFLCSPDADYITAANLRADGGFWLPSRAAHS